MKRLLVKSTDNYCGILACLAASSSAINAGFAISFSSPALQDLESGKGTILLTQEGATWFGSLLPLTAMCGSLLSGPLMDQLGRRLTILLVVICFLIGWITMFLSSGYLMLFSGRGLSGLATGMSFAVLPVYISEISPAFLRGTMGSVFCVLLALGIPVGYTAGIFFTWREMAELGAALACVTFIICYLLPESPYWLLRQNKKEEAARCLRVLRGKSSDVQDELKEIECLQEELSTPVTLKEIMSQSFLKPVGIGVMLMIFQQFSGVNAIFFYAHKIFKRANFQNEALASILVSTIHVIALALVAFITDRFGRRKLLFISAFGMMLCHAVIGGCFYILSYEKTTEVNEIVPLTSSPLPELDFYSNNSYSYEVSQQFDNKYPHSNATGQMIHYKETTKEMSLASWLSLVFVMLYISLYSIGLGPIPFIALSEMLPQRGRGVAGGIGTMSNWLCAFTLTKTFVGLVNLVSTSGVFFIFSVICFLSIIFIWKCVPETKGKSLSEIQALFFRVGTKHSTNNDVTTPIRIVNQVVAASPLLRGKRSSSLQEQCEILMNNEVEYS